MKQQVSLFGSPTRVFKDESFTEILEEMVENNMQNDDPFLILDVGDIVKKIKTWQRLLPRVKLFYAMKCNHHPYVLNVLNALGTGFDCATKTEFERVLSLGVDPSRIIYANPCKQLSYLRAAKSHSVNLMTFDNIVELKKLKAEYPEARLVLRIRSDALASMHCLGNKFGVIPESASVLLRAARELDLNVVGVAFHVGSECEEPQAFQRALKRTKKVFEEAKIYGYNLNLIDIGGGFRGNIGTSLDEMAYYVNQGLAEHFPDDKEVEKIRLVYHAMMMLGSTRALGNAPGVHAREASFFKNAKNDKRDKVIAEPGTYVVASAFTLVTKVISKQCSNLEECGPPFSYYLNEGTYGSLNFIKYGHLVQPCILKKFKPDELCHVSTLWGPTCDSIDLIASDILLPELHPDDCIYFRNMGAYTLVLSSEFNGFHAAKVHMIVPYHEWNYLDKLLSRSGASSFHKKDIENLDEVDILSKSKNSLVMWEIGIKSK